MDIQAHKIELAKLILEIDNPSLLSKVFKLLKKEKTDFWLELSEEQKEEINIGIKQLDRGERISVKEFLRKVS
jgi:hypothetical protein